MRSVLPNRISTKKICRAPVLPVREYVIMQLVNTITDKSDWQRKVFDDAIIAKWKTEIDMMNALDDTPEAMAAISSKDEWTSLASNESTSNTVGIDGTQQIIDHTRKHVTPKMFAWAIAEVKHKAIIFETINCVEALDGVWKSDTVIGQDLRKALEIAVQPLEAVPEVGLRQLHQTVLAPTMTGFLWALYTTAVN